MYRRDFMYKTSLASISLSMMPTAKFTKPVITAQDLQDYLRNILEVPEPSVDRIIIGDPSTKIKKVATLWTPYLKSLEKAVEEGVNVIVAHEPTFYTHWDLDQQDRDFYTAPEAGKQLYLDAIKKKKEFIEKHGLVVIRCHDVTDALQKIGVPFGLGQALGYDREQLVSSKKYFNVYEIERKKASEVARDIAKALKALNQPGVGFYGDPDYQVERVGLGTGYICDHQLYAELKPDLCIMINDTFRTWIHGEFATDTGKPFVIIDHGTAEEMAMKLLNDYLSERIPRITFINFKQGCGYQWID